jgi:hypothetical protein
VILRYARGTVSATETTPATDRANAATHDFIARGYLNVASELPGEAHLGLYRELVELQRRGEALENGVLWRVPGLAAVFDHPAMRAAITRLLGADYVMNPHTYCHLSRPGSAGHAWHKDSYVVDHNTRHPRPRWLMAFYSPQRLTDELGPTTVLPGWQYHETLPADIAASDGHALVAEPGTVTLLHPDMWHGARGNRSGDDRFVVKMLFERRAEPVPGATPRDAGWRRHADDRIPMLSRDVWGWLHGVAPAADGGAVQNDGELTALIGALDSANETLRLRAAYALGRVGAAAVEPLVAQLRASATEHVSGRRPVDPRGINPTALPAAQALVAIGGAAVEGLAELLTDRDRHVRRIAAEALGNLGPAAVRASAALARLGGDADWWVRRNAMEALGRVGGAEEVVGAALVRGLSDGDVRVRLNAAVAAGKWLEPPRFARAALGRAARGDDNRYVRYYARLALGHAEGHAAADGPVRAGWEAMTSVTTEPGPSPGARDAASR